MSVIVRMEMPTGCANCPMGDDDSRFCKAAKEYIPMLGRPSWCPIVGVLPEEHGDLIDRDVLYMAVKSHNTSDAAIARNHNRVTSLQNLSTIRKGYIAEKHICLDDIIRAEAVIKAERKDDEH